MSQSLNFKTVTFQRILESLFCANRKESCLINHQIFLAELASCHVFIVLVSLFLRDEQVADEPAEVQGKSPVLQESHLKIREIKKGQSLRRKVTSAFHQSGKCPS